MRSGYIKIACKSLTILENVSEIISENFGSVISRNVYNQTEDGVDWQIVELVIDLKNGELNYGTAFKLEEDSLDTTDQTAVDEFLKMIEDFFDIKRNPTNINDEYAIKKFEQTFDEMFETCKNNFIAYGMPHKVPIVWSKNRIEYSDAPGSIVVQDAGGIRECVRDAFAVLVNRYKPENPELAVTTWTEKIFRSVDDAYKTELTKTAINDGFKSLLKV